MICASPLSVLCLATALLAQDQPPAAPKLPPDAVPRLAAACNRFAEAMQPRVLADGQGVTGPGSVALALLMLLPGARGETARELEQVLQLPADLRGEAFGPTVEALLAGLGVGERGARGSTVCRLANDLWPQQGMTVEADYTRLLTSRFGAAVTPLDYQRDAAAARAAINRRVAEVTAGRIPELLPQGLLDASTRLVLTNAMWLRGPWQHPFAEGATHPAAFRLASGETVRVPTMRGDHRFRYAESEQWFVVEMPFAGGDFAMEVGVPRRSATLPVVEQALLAGRHRPALAPQPVQLFLPQFTIAGGGSLKTALQALGLHSAFTGAADFSGIEAGRSLYLEEVVHQAWLRVDEHGAEAAAATAAVMKRTGADNQGDVRICRVDRPFAVAVRHVPSGLLLFAGRVIDPRVAGR